jgi:isopentenyl-diphosphate delta-isomerase
MFILNSLGEIYVPTRTADKTIAPNGYDYSVGGHVEIGEKYLATIIREAREELNLDIDPDYLLLIDKTIFDEIKYIRHLYVYRTEETPEFNREDFVTAEWMKPEKLIEKLDDGHPAKGSLKASVSLLSEFLRST